MAVSISSPFQRLQGGQVDQRISATQLSARGEIEITAVNRAYLEHGDRFEPSNFVHELRAQCYANSGYGEYLLSIYQSTSTTRV